MLYSTLKYLTRNLVDWNVHPLSFSHLFISFDLPTLNHVGRRCKVVSCTSRIDRGYSGFCREEREHKQRTDFIVKEKGVFPQFTPSLPLWTNTMVAHFPKNLKVSNKVVLRRVLFESYLIHFGLNTEESVILRTIFTILFDYSDSFVSIMSLRDLKMSSIFYTTPKYRR